MLSRYRLIDYENGETIGIASDVYSAAIGCAFQEEGYENRRIRCYDLERAKQVGSQVLVFEYSPEKGFVFEGGSRYADEAFTEAMTQIVRMQEQIDKLRPMANLYKLM